MSGRLSRSASGSAPRQSFPGACSWARAWSRSSSRSTRCSTRPRGRRRVAVCERALGSARVDRSLPAGRAPLLARDLLGGRRPERDDPLDRPLRRLRAGGVDPPVLQQDAREPGREPAGAGDRGRSRERRPVRARPALPAHRERGGDLRRGRGESGRGRLADGHERRLPAARRRHPPRASLRAVRRDRRAACKSRAPSGTRSAARRVHAPARALRRLRGGGARGAGGARRPLRLRVLDSAHRGRARRPAVRGREQRLRPVRRGSRGAGRCRAWSGSRRSGAGSSAFRASRAAGR